MKQSKNKKILLVIPLLLAVVVAYCYISYAQSQPPPVTPPQDTDTDGDGKPEVKFSFSVFQGEHLFLMGGGDTWKYPQAVTSLSPLGIIDLDNGRAVSQIQTCIFFAIVSNKTISKVDFVCAAKLQLYDGNKNYLMTIGTEQLISKTVQNPAIDGSAVSALSASVTASDFQKILVPAGQTIDADRYFVVVLREIGAGVTFSDGTSKSFAATGVQAAENQLWWKFHVSQNGSVMEVVNLETSWRWN